MFQIKPESKINSRSDNEHDSKTDKKIDEILKKKLGKIRLFIFDVDGTLTDGNLYFDDNGEKIKVFNVKDGLAMKVAGKLGYFVAIVTGRESDMVLHRSGELGLFACVQKVWNKKEACEKIIKQAGLKKEQVLFVGDDIIDIPGMKACGVSAAVADSSSEVLEQADFVTFRSGGQGAAREIISLVLKCQNRSLMEAFDF